jgi:hypothetical protein
MTNYLNIIKTMAISQLQKDLIIGTILGDATINKSGDSKAILRFGQGFCNKEYLYYLFEIMKEYSSQPQPNERIYTDPRFNKEYRSYNFSTKSSTIFYPFLKLFTDSTIKTGRVLKIIPECIPELLTPGALAF